MVPAGYAALLALSARALSAHQRWRLLAVTAVLTCALVPVGTLLGVLTLIVLLRPEVQVLFGRPAPQA